MLLGFMVGLLHAIRTVYSSQVHIWVNTEGCQHVHKRTVIISDHNNSQSLTFYLLKDCFVAAGQAYLVLSTKASYSLQNSELPTSITMKLVLVVLFFRRKLIGDGTKEFHWWLLLSFYKVQWAPILFGLSQKYLWEWIHYARAEKLVSNFGALLNQNRKGSFILERKRSDIFLWSFAVHSSL